MIKPGQMSKEVSAYYSDLTQSGTAKIAHVNLSFHVARATQIATFWVLAEVLVEIQVVWGVTPYQLANIY